MTLQDSLRELEQKVLDILDELTPEDAEVGHPCHQAYKRIGKLFNEAFLTAQPQVTEEQVREKMMHNEWFGEHAHYGGPETQEKTQQPAEPAPSQPPAESDVETCEWCNGYAIMCADCIKAHDAKIRDEALEEAAQLVEVSNGMDVGLLATKIRALKPAPTDNPQCTCSDLYENTAIGPCPKHDKPAPQWIVQEPGARARLEEAIWWANRVGGNLTTCEREHLAALEKAVAKGQS